MSEVWAEDRAAFLQRVASMRLLFPSPPADSIVQNDVIPYVAGSSDHMMRIIRPALSEAPLPLVLFVSGYADSGMQSLFRCNWQDLGQINSWMRLLASAGIATASYVNKDPVIDARTALQFLTEQAKGRGIDAARIGIWSCSGNVPNALGLLASAEGAKVNCAVFNNGITWDQPGDTQVAAAAKQFGFCLPVDHHALESIPDSLTMLMVRSGRDATPGLNVALDGFVSQALRANRRLELINHAEAPHNYEVMHDSDVTRWVIQRTVDFYRHHLGT